MLRVSNAEFSICAYSVQVVVTSRRSKKKWEPITEKEERSRIDWNTVHVSGSYYCVKRKRGRGEGEVEVCGHCSFRGRILQTGSGKISS